MRAFICTQAQAEHLRDIIAKADGLPRQGVPVPGGVHGDAGGTLYYVDVIQHPSGEPWACPVDAHVEDLVASSLLDQAETEELLAAAVASVELDSSWQPAPLQAPLGGE